MNHKLGAFGNLEEAQESLLVKECFFCGNKNLRPFAATPRSLGLLHVAQVRCKTCGLVIAQPQASGSRLKSYYKQNYYEMEWPDAAANWAGNIKNYQRQELPLIERLCRDWLPPVGGRALEIGCGYGAMLSVLRQKGYYAYGFDISFKAMAFCNSKGLPVVEAESENIPFKPGTFDLVIAMYVIEHMNDPRSFVKKVVELARPGGVIILITDDANSSQYAWHRLKATTSARAAPLCSSADHTFVFKAHHLKSLLQESGCSQVRLEKFHLIPEHESLHWHIYKSLFRMADRLSGRGEFILAAGRRGS